MADLSDEDVTGSRRTMLDEFEKELVMEIVEEAQKIRVQQVELIEKSGWDERYKLRADYAWDRLNKIAQLLMDGKK